MRIGIRGSRRRGHWQTRTKREVSRCSTHRQKRLRLLLLSVIAALATSLPTNAAAEPPTFGLNYWPQCSSNNVLGDSDGMPEMDPDDWNEQKPIVRRDLDHIASLGAGIVRFVIVPNGERCNGTSWSAWDRPGQGQGGILTSEFTYETGIDPTEGTSNVADLVGLAKYRRLKVILSFANTNLKLPQPNDPAGRKRWEWAYGIDGWNRPGTGDADDGFLQDSAKWINGYVDPIEGNAGIPPCWCRDAVIGYDYFNEATEIKDSGGTTRSWEYLDYVSNPNNSRVPVGKRLVSVLRADPVTNSPSQNLNDGKLVKDNFAGTLDFVDFHSYDLAGVNPDPEGSYDYLKQLFPTSTVLMGEFGGDAPLPSDEAHHRTVVEDYVVRARTSRLPAPEGIPYYMNWMLWDMTPPLAPKARGLGYGPHSPKDALGTLAVELNKARPQSPASQLVPNADMEMASGNPAKPENWSAGPVGPDPDDPTVKLKSGGPTANAATNTRYARAELPMGHAAPLIWIFSDPIAVPEFAPAGRRLMVNGYVRASPSMEDIGLAVAQYDVAGAEIDTPRKKAPVFDPPTVWSWRNYLHAMPGLQSWSVDLHPNTKKIVVVFSGSITQSPSYLDVDAVSAAVRPVP